MTETRTQEVLTSTAQAARMYADAKETNPKQMIGTDKIPLHLWPITATIFGCLGLLDGALKYGRSNWRHSGVRASVYKDALDRHVGAWFEGEDIDPDSGLPHLSHALACLAIIVDAHAAGVLEDDRQFSLGATWAETHPPVEPHTGSAYRGFLTALTTHVPRLRQRLNPQPKHYTIQDNPRRDA